MLGKYPIGLNEVVEKTLALFWKKHKLKQVTQGSRVCSCKGRISLEPGEANSSL